MKLLLLTIREIDEESDEDQDPETYLLEGDRRQSNERIVKRGIEKLLDEPVKFVDEDKNRVKTISTERVFAIEEDRLLDDEEAREMNQKHFKLIVNENVTEQSCRVRYS